MTHEGVNKAPSPTWDATLLDRRTCEHAHKSNSIYELSVAPNDIVVVLCQRKDGWTCIEHDGRIGMVPLSCLQSPPFYNEIDSSSTSEDDDEHEDWVSPVSKQQQQQRQQQQRPFVHS